MRVGDKGSKEHTRQATNEKAHPLKGVGLCHKRREPYVCFKCLPAWALPTHDLPTAMSPQTASRNTIPPTAKFTADSINPTNAKRIASIMVLTPRCNRLSCRREELPQLLYRLYRM